MRSIFIAVPMIFWSGVAISEQTFQDKDWSHKFYGDCGLPENSVNWVTDDTTKFLRFSLKDGQKGFCSSDRQNRGGAPYWERAELISGTGPKSKFVLRPVNKYHIKLRVRFVEGFTGDRESIFQLKQKCGSKGYCPPMFMLRSTGYAPYPANLYVEALSDPEGGKKSWNSRKAYRVGATKITNEAGISFRPSNYYGEWLDFNLRLSVEPKASVLWTEIKTKNGDRYLNTAEAVAIGNASPPFIKVGLYRAGSTGFPNDRSTVDYDIISITKLDD